MAFRRSAHFWAQGGGRRGGQIPKGTSALILLFSLSKSFLTARWTLFQIDHGAISPSLMVLLRQPRSCKTKPGLVSCIDLCSFTCPLCLVSARLGVTGYGRNCNHSGFTSPDYYSREIWVLFVGFGQIENLRQSTVIVSISFFATSELPW